MHPTSRRIAARWMGWLAGLLAFALYAYTAAPGIVTFFDDTLEFQTVAPTFGIAHPTGYPLYTLLGGLWTRLLPIGTWAGRLNLLSALFAAGAVGLVATTAGRLTTHRDGTPNLWAGLAAAASFALGPVWWSQATVAEVYALHGLLVAAVLATTVGINQSRHFDRRMAWLMLLFGLGLAHHRTILLLAPPVALYLLWSVPGFWRPRRAWWLWAAALLLPLLLYLYIPFRAAMGVRDLNGSYRPGWAGFWTHVLALDYGAFFADNALARSLTFNQWFELVRDQTGWHGLTLALLGLAWLVARDPAQKGWRPARAWWLVVGVLLINLIFAMLYRVPDPEVFLLPALLCLAILSGGGVGLAARLLPSAAASAVSALLIGFLIVMPLGRAGAVNRRHDWTVHDQARRLAQANFLPQSHVIGLEGEMTALRYMQIAEQRGGNATLLVANDPEQRRQAVAELVDRGVPVYLTRELEGIGDDYSYSGDADLVRVWPRGQSQVALPSVEETLPGTTSERLPPLLLDNGRVQIEAYSVRQIAGLARPALELTLYWRVLSPTGKTLKVSLRVVDANGTPYEWVEQGWPANVSAEEVRVTIEDRFPLRQVAYVPEWLPGELVQDVHTIPLPPILEETSDQATRLHGESPTLLVIIYDSATSMEEGRIEIMF